MNRIEDDAKRALAKLLSAIVPKTMTTAERVDLAKRAGISAETLRNTLRRQSMHADTLLRLLLARGVPLKVLSNLPQTETSMLSEAEAQWLELGRELSEAEKREFADLVKYLRSRWELK